MIRKALPLKIFDAAYMQRWNDKVRPVEMIERVNIAGINLGEIYSDFD